MILLIDVIEGLRTLPNESADIIISDPPYNIYRYFGRQEINEYIKWSFLWIDECIRILKSSGTLFIYGFSEILAHISSALTLEHRWLIWHYSNKTVPQSTFWQRSHEAILCAWKNKGERIFNLDAVREPYTEAFVKSSSGRVRRNTKGRFGNKETTYKAHEKGALPRDVIKIPSLAGGAGAVERWGYCLDHEGVVLTGHKECNVMKHPTQKPMELARRLLLSAKPESQGFVVVPFVGSGSECLVAKQLNLDFIGFETNPIFVKMSKGILNEKG